MDFDTRILELLGRHEDMKRQGTPIAPKELCRDCPELLEEIKHRILDLEALQPFVDTTIDMSKTPGESPPLPELPGYEILGVLGRGGMGVVYKARQLGLNRLVALKMILAGGHATEDQLARFRAEAEAVAQLPHTNIVQIYEIGAHQGLPYLSLEFCAGGSLANRLGGTPLDTEQAAPIVRQLAQAMQVAHQAGIVHRDLKPQNILLVPVDLASGNDIPHDAPLTVFQPKVADFGLAKKLEEPGLTAYGDIVGTPSYMAPEQAQGVIEAIGPAADVYALGAILYELLTGRPPFRAATKHVTITQVINDEPVPPRVLQPHTPCDLETICLKCLQKDISKRYRSAQELADDLARYVNREPIHARPTPMWERLGKWARRKPYQAALAGAVAVLLAMIFAYQSQQAIIYKDKYDRSVRAAKLREQAEQFLLEAKQAEVLKDWNKAKNMLGTALASFSANPDLQAEELRIELTRRLELVEERLQAVKRLATFHPLYDEALFYATPFTGLDLIGSWAQTRAAAHKALAVYHLAGTGGVSTSELEQDRKHLTANDFTRLIRRCYELLLVSADAEAVPPPGQAEGPVQIKAGAIRALHFLEQAAGLGKDYQLDSQTYHIRKARYTALSNGKPIDSALPDGAPLPNGAMDWFFNGLENYRAGHFDAARADCTKTLELEEDHFWALYVRALCYLKLDQWADAKADLTVCLDRRRSFVFPLLLRGYASSALGELRRASEDYNAAEADFNKALETDRDPLVRYAGLTNRGVLFIRREHWQLGIADLKEAVRLKPSNLPAYINLAKAYEGAKQFEQAVSALNQAIKLDPKRPYLYENRSQLDKLRGDPASARADLVRAIACYPEGSQDQRLAEDHVRLGGFLDLDKLHEKALTEFALALEINPKYTPAYSFQADSLLALGRHKEAGEALDHYLRLTPQPTAKIYKNRGLIYHENRQYRAAVEMYTLALRQDPADDGARGLRGWSYLFMNAAQPALEDFDEILKNDPKNVDALAGRGNARIRLRQLKDAVADAEAALKQKSQSDRLLYNVTCIYALAVAQTDLELRAGQARQAESRIELFEKKALDCLARTLQATPPEKQRAFWREKIANNPALASIRRGALYFQFERKYGGK